MRIDLREEQAEAGIVLRVKGRLDSTTSPLLRERLNAILGGASARVLVDFSELEYISSAGFRVLLLAAKHADLHACQIALCGVQGKVRQLFDLGGFLDLFTISSSRDEGIAGLK